MSRRGTDSTTITTTFCGPSEKHFRDRYNKVKDLAEYNNLDIGELLEEYSLLKNKGKDAHYKEIVASTLEHVISGLESRVE